MKILGISAWYHDSAACLIEDGKILCAAQEERFTRKKHDANFPKESIAYCLSYSGLKPSDLDGIVFYEKPFLKFERLLETYLAYAPKGYKSFSNSMPIWIKEKLFQKYQIIKELENNISGEINWKDKLYFSEHHLSHAASAFFPSPFKKAAVLTLDAVGEWATTSLAIGNANELEVHKEIHFPHSIGLLYSAFTYYTGFRVNSGEYKLMGLAPYGEPKFINLIKDNLIEIKEDGSFHLNMQYFDYCTGMKMTNKKFNKLFGGPPRNPEEEITQHHMNLASSVQKIIEEVVIKISRNIAKETGEKNLCLAGGVALNCVSNGVLVKENIFENIWIQPAAGDAGGALGAALAVNYIVKKSNRELSSLDSMQGSYLGPSYKKDEVEESLKALGASYEHLSEVEISKRTVEAIINGKAVGWMQGRMEFGPRALGNRSIIADPRSSKIQKQLNLKVKFRESFRPFAPSVLIEDVNEWFNLDQESPYMLIVADIKDEKRIQMSQDELGLFGIDKLNIKRSNVPAITHVDYSSRIQTVHKETNPKFYNLISNFKEITGCPILVNTSFNVRGEPIVCTPEDAFKCFMGTDLDLLVIENFILYKENQSEALKEDYKEKYELD
ncbi:carbamoyltransferase [Gammaproteobacteria bacterium]|nr:carbamoyltransferase [Gammaproteobacteria bacterium]